MANYSTLKEAVADVVKTNGSQAITGSNLQAVLLSIINSIGGGGYIFAGVATPSTNPGTPDQNVFYIGGAGTYANFGTPVNVPPTGIAVFKYNGSWTCEQVTVDGGGVFDISSFKAVGGTLATYADLAAALGTNGANVPESVRKGGMSIKFVQSSDNKYVQYRLKKPTFSTQILFWIQEKDEFVSPLFFRNIIDENINGIKEIYLTGLNANKTYKCFINTHGGSKDIFVYESGVAVAGGSYSSGTFVRLTERNNSGISGYGIVKSQSITGVVLEDAAELINVNVSNIDNSPTIKLLVEQGKLSDLTTTAKNTVVAAINELNANKTPKSTTTQIQQDIDNLEQGVEEIGKYISSLYFSSIPDKNINAIKELYLEGLNSNETYTIFINTYGGAKNIYVKDGNGYVANGNYAGGTLATIKERNSSGINGYAVLKNGDITGVLQDKAAVLINKNVSNINNSPQIAQYVNIEKDILGKQSLFARNAQIGLNGGVPQIYVESVSDDNYLFHFKLTSLSNMYCDYGFWNLPTVDATVSVTGNAIIIHVLYDTESNTIVLEKGNNNSWSLFTNKTKFVYLGNVYAYNGQVFRYNFTGHFYIDGTEIDTRANQKQIDVIVGEMPSTVKSTVKMSIADVIPIVHNNRLEIFRKSITTEVCDLYDLRGVTSGSGYTPTTLDRGRFRSNGYIFDSTSERNSFDIEFRLIDYSSNFVRANSNVNIIPLAKKPSPASNKNILVIGDSYTWINTWVEEFSRRLTGSGGSPVADNLSNITFIGTHYNTGKVPSEGWSSQDYGFFTGSSSPFYINGNIDIAQYVSDNNYGSIDYAIILLGCNGTNSDANIKALYDVLLAYNPSMKILVGSNAMKYNQYGWNNGYGLSAGMHSSAWKAWAEWNDNLRNIIKTSYSSNIFYVEIPAQVDIENNFQYELGDANNRNSAVQIKYGIDNVHPASSAYLQIADAFYSAFHYWCL